MTWSGLFRQCRQIVPFRFILVFSFSEMAVLWNTKWVFFCERMKFFSLHFRETLGTLLVRTASINPICMLILPICLYTSFFYRSLYIFFVPVSINTLVSCLCTYTCFLSLYIHLIPALNIHFFCLSASSSPVAPYILFWPVLSVLCFSVSIHHLPTGLYLPFSY
jgi:uncharacterized membrane protein